MVPPFIIKNVQNTMDEGIVLDILSKEIYFFSNQGLLNIVPLNMVRCNYILEKISESSIYKYSILISNNIQKYSNHRVIQILMICMNIQLRIVTLMQKICIPKLLTSSTECAICFENLKTFSIVHMFHPNSASHFCCLECFDRYKNNTCPFCRKKVSNLL